MQSIRVIFALLVAFLAAPSLPLGAQVMNPIADLRLTSVQKGRWLIAGQVKSLRGEPVSNAQVTIHCTSTGILPNNSLVADVQGKYSYTVELEAESNTSLSVLVSAQKEGFLPAHENASFTKVGETYAIDLVLRPQEEDAFSLSQDQLLALLIPRYKAASTPDLQADSARQNFVRAAGLAPDPQNSAKVVSLLSPLVKKTPQCVECRTLLGLAELQAGSMASAQRDFSEAALVKLSPSEERRTVNALITLGVFAEWSGESSKALGLLMQASKLAPEDPLALQEVGRVLLNQKNWEAADQYLLNAEKAGASPQARLLRCRAALEEGDVQEADQEIRAYLSGREIKTLPFPVRALYQQVQTQASLLSFSRAKALVDEELPQILKEWPELAGLEPAAD